MAEIVTTQNLDAGKSPERLLAERAKRFQDAAELKQPDRVPILLLLGYKLADLGGITRQEWHDNPEKAAQILERVALEYQPDTIAGPLGGPKPAVAVGDRMTKWPGYGLDPNASFQFVEHEFMKADDYDEFLDDPADWGVRVYMPRAFSEMEGLAMLPPLGMSLLGYANLRNLMVLTDPRVASALRALANAAQAVAEEAAYNRQLTQRMAALGFPLNPFAGCVAVAPFDFMSDTLRGMRGIFLDMLKRPEKLLAAQEKVARIQIKHIISWCRATGLMRTFFPLHRGSDGFMSIPQFEKFYWPQLRDMFIELIDNGITPYVFYEGVWDERLKYLAELPRGKTIGRFQASDIFKVKEAVGDTMCIVGGMPNSMLQGGSVQEVRERTRQLCEVVGKGGGFVMSTGVGELEGSQPELIKAWVDATREYGVY